MKHVTLKHLMGTGSLLAVLCLTAPALAQAVPDAQTGIASPGRVEGQIRPPEFTTRISPQIEIRETQIAKAPEGAESVTFVLTDVSISGMSVYNSTDVRDIYASRINTEISLADVYGMAADLTRRYRNDGYILTQVIVPPQTIDDGSIQLQVVEGFIDNINVRGDAEGDGELTLVRTYAERARTGSALNSDDLERSLLLINDLPGVNARAVLSPSPTQTGAANLDVIVDRNNFIGEVGIDNYGTRFLGPVQLSGSVAANSLLGLNERITTQAVWGIDTKDELKELAYVSALYDQPILDNGTIFSLFGSYTNTEPGFRLEQFDVKGYARRAYAQLAHPFIRSREFNVTGRALLDYNNVTTTNNLIGVPTLDDRIRTFRTGANVDFLDTLFGVAFNSFDLQYSRGLDIMNATDENDTDVSRPGAEADFNKLNLTAQRLQRLTGSFNLLLGFTGQVSDGPLFSSEEFGLGGVNFGRGYDSSEVIGDEGFGGTIELQWNNPVYLNESVDYQLYSFFDAGRVYDDDATIAALEKETLTSAGFGIRSDWSTGTAAGAMVAFPMNQIPQTQNDKDPRFYFNFSQSF